MVGQIEKEGAELKPQYLDATNTELDKSAKHLSASDLVGSSADCALNEQAIIMGLQIRKSLFFE